MTMTMTGCSKIKLVIGKVRTIFQGRLSPDENREVCAQAIRRKVQDALIEASSKAYDLRHKGLSVPDDIKVLEKGWPYCKACGKPKDLHFLLGTAGPTWGSPTAVEMTSDEVFFICQS